MKFDRFRAYTQSEATRSALFDVEDDEGKITKQSQVVESWPSEDVAFEGDAAKDGEHAEFDAGDTVITKIVFYRGEVDGERVVGSADVGESGEISVYCPDRAPKEA